MHTMAPQTDERVSSTSSWRAVALLITGAVIFAAVLVLGSAARLPAVTAWGLAVDEQIAALRTPALTGTAAAFTHSATPEITGIGAVIVIPVVLLILRRWFDAVQAACVLVGSLGAAVVVKALVAEPRPPKSLWAISADADFSYPSGHTVVAAAVVVALVVVSRTRRWRLIFAIVGGVYAAAVAVSRIVVGNHYPPDVLGSLLLGLAAGCVVAGLAQLPVVRRLDRRTAPQLSERTSR